MTTYTTPSGATVSDTGQLITPPPATAATPSSQTPAVPPATPGTSTTPTSTSAAPPPPSISANLAPGSTDKTDVTALQNYLAQMGYLSPDQIATGPGIYGPKTTAAVAKLQQDLGIQAGSGAGYYGPQTKSALSQKYQSIFDSLKNKPAPDQSSAATSTINALGQTSTDPVFGSMMASVAPILDSLTQIMNNINNPMLTGVSLQQEYNDMASKAGLPAINAQLMNMQNVMNGTEQDVRDEITKSGGFATDSQVMALSAARNKVIMKQYTALSTQYNAATQNIQNMMQFASTDQSVALQKQQMSASVAESMASIESQMVNMGMTMQQHTTDNLNKIVSNVGYQGLATQASGNPQMLSYYEQMLGLSKGSLSNPESLKQLETYRQQQLALGQQKVNIQMYNAGLGGMPTGTNSNTPGLYVNNPSGAGQSLVSLNTNGTDDQGRPYSFTQAQAANLLKNGATTDPGTNNIIVPGIGYYITQPDGSYRLSIDPSSTEGQFIQYRNRAENPTPWSPRGSPSQQRLARNAMTRQVNSALTQYVNSPLYKNVSATATYFAKLQAGLQNPGSVGDPDIIDSLVKINTGGTGTITEQQYQAYAQGQTWADMFQVSEGKVVRKGGTLSPAQRNDINTLAQQTFSNYRGEYEQMYTQAMKNLDNQGIPDAFWGNMPDWTSLMSGVVYQPNPTQ